MFVLPAALGCKTYRHIGREKKPSVEYQALTIHPVSTDIYLTELLSMSCSRFTQTNKIHWYICLMRPPGGSFALIPNGELYLQSSFSIED